MPRNGSEAEQGRRGGRESISERSTEMRSARDCIQVSAMTHSTVLMYHPLEDHGDSPRFLYAMDYTSADHPLSWVRLWTHFAGRQSRASLSLQHIL